ncbi:MAG: thioredoxin [Paludibacteraceae bacterium]|jgi:thioredoxin 1|nr:thioredoxin [Paludibacteraceae bacterium]MCR5297948.1 thioredoxin [Paludibacteraceae bacterium]
MTQTLTDQNFAAETAEGITVVDCWAAWCGPCKRLGPVIDKIADDYAGRVKVGKLDVDENMEIPQQFGIMSIPTVLFFRNGELVDKTVGLVPESEITRRIDAMLSK